MAIAYDTASSISGDAVSSLTIPAFATTGSDRYCYVGIAWSQSAPGAGRPDVTRGGSEVFSELFEISGTQGNNFDAWGFGYIAPATGSASVLVEMGASSWWSCGAVALTGVHQTTPTGTAGSAESGTDPPTVTVTAADDEWLIDTVASWADGLTAGADQTDRWNEFVDIITGASSTQLGSVAGDVMSWSVTSGGDEWAIGAIPIKPAGAAGPTGPPQLPLMGVG